MPAGDDRRRYDEPNVPSADLSKDAWERTLSEMDDLADELERDGWNVLAIPSGAIAPEPPDAGVEGRSGFVHAIPGNFVDEFESLFAPGEYGKYDVFRQNVSGEVFLVLALYSSRQQGAILLSGVYRITDAVRLYNSVQQDGIVHTHIQRVNGSHLGTFEHEEYEKFFPESIENYVWDDRDSDE